MNRTFTHRVTLPALAGIVLIAALALYFFWHRGPVMVVAATLLTVLDVLAIERVIHTTYTLTSDGRLTISKGRFARQQEIPLGDVRSVSVHSAPFNLYRYILVEYGGRGEVAVMTENDDAFLKEITKRIKNTENED